MKKEEGERKTRVDVVRIAVVPMTVPMANIWMSVNYVITQNSEAGSSRSTNNLSEVDKIQQCDEDALRSFTYVLAVGNQGLRLASRRGPALVGHST